MIPDLFDLSFTAHFVENWRSRVGGEPTLPLVRHAIRHSIRVQTGRQLRTPAGQHYNTLTIYWNPDLNVIITLDNATHRAVSVLTADLPPKHFMAGQSREKEMVCDLPN